MPRYTDLVFGMVTSEDRSDAVDGERKKNNKNNRKPKETKEVDWTHTSFEALIRPGFRSTWTWAEFGPSSSHHLVRTVEALKPRVESFTNMLNSSHVGVQWSSSNKEVLDIHHFIYMYIYIYIYTYTMCVFLYVYMYIEYDIKYVYICF